MYKNSVQKKMYKEKSLPEMQTRRQIINLNYWTFIDATIFSSTG
jgi:hypothetical protein